MIFEDKTLNAKSLNFSYGFWIVAVLASVVDQLFTNPLRVLAYIQITARRNMFEAKAQSKCAHRF
ncbi:MAG: hypothetical protein ACI9HA_003327 [Dinoroseobacter sp.]|jgi:hypothetical protein